LLVGGVVDQPANGVVERATLDDGHFATLPRSTGSGILNG
jgi:hypothetical protein